MLGIFYFLKLDDEELFILQVTHSSGNHGQGLAWAAKTAGVKCCVVVPNNAPKSKADAIKGYGAELVWCEPTPKDRYTCNHGFISIQFYWHQLLQFD